MTSDELALIRTNLDAARDAPAGAALPLLYFTIGDVSRLLAEVDRLRAERAAFVRADEARVNVLEQIWTVLGGPTLPGDPHNEPPVSGDVEVDELELARRVVAERDRLQSDLDEQRRQVLHLQNFINNPEKVVLEYERDSGQVTATVKHLAVRAFVESFARTIGDAPNFVTMDATLEAGEFVVTVQRRHGKSPAQALTELRADRDRLAAMLADQDRYQGSLAAVLTRAGRSAVADREELGRAVRVAWVGWARTQPNPKASWLVPYSKLSERDKEADRQIGEHICRLVQAAHAEEIAKLEADRDRLAARVAELEGRPSVPPPSLITESAKTA